MKSSIIVIIIIGLLGCHYSMPPLKKSDKSKETMEARNLIFKFSIAGAGSDMVELLIPPENRAAPYIWWKVPNNDSPIQMVRACNFYESYDRTPVNTDRWWCWDKRAKTLKHHLRAKSYKDFVRLHPALIWLIGNEPDIESQDNLTPLEYAEFYGWIAKTITNQVRLEDPKAFPKMVLCQTGANPKYCETAYFYLKELIKSGHWPDWPENLEVKDTIWAISVHKYANDGFFLEEEKLSVAINDWKKAMNRFVRWSNTVDSSKLAHKPLWVTEFGALEAFCPEKLEMREGVDHIAGIECPSTANRGNGFMGDDYVFYGRNNREGIWGLQYRQIEYFVNPDNAFENNQGDWKAAWWFVSQRSGFKKGECGYTAWLFGDNTNCDQNQDVMSRAGETYRDSIKCIIYGTQCPELY
jgi:hypothetical protein